MPSPSLRFIRGGTFRRCGLKGCEKHAEFWYGNNLLLCEKHARYVMVGQRIVSDENEARNAAMEKSAVDDLLASEQEEPGGNPDELKDVRKPKGG